MAKSYVGTCPCPQHLGRNHAGHIMCMNRANVYKLDDGSESYASECAAGHIQHFGGYYLKLVNGNDPEIVFPPLPA
jgi:hypothetical protein